MYIYRENNIIGGKLDRTINILILVICCCCMCIIIIIIVVFIYYTYYNNTNTKSPSPSTQPPAALSTAISPIQTSTIYFTNESNSYFNLTNNLGIALGSTIPKYPLHVGASTINETITNGLIYQTSTFLKTQTLAKTISIKAENSIWTAGNFIYSSDNRIKKNIRDIDDNTALNKILSFKPKLYNYIDVVKQGDKDVIGFIAQDIQKVEPLAVTIHSEFIPNIYKSVDIVDDTFYLKNAILKINDEIKILDLEGNTQVCTIKNINDNNNKIIIDKKINGNKCFIYGSKVDDFHSLNKDYIFTLNVSATQDLYKLIQQQNLIIQDLQNRITILENK